MIVDNRVRDALDLKTLKLPDSPQVVRIEAEDYTDWTGDDALQVNVILAEDVDEYKFKGEDILAIHRSIHDSLLAQGITVFPYIRLYKASEMTDDNSEE